MRREFSVLAEGRHIFGRRPKPREKLAPEAFRAGHYKDLTETGNRARKVSGTQGMLARSSLLIPEFLKIISLNKHGHLMVSVEEGIE